MMISCRMVTFPRTTQNEMRTVAAAYSPSRKLDRVNRISGESELPAHRCMNPDAGKSGIFLDEMKDSPLPDLPRMYHWTLRAPMMRLKVRAVRL